MQKHDESSDRKTLKSGWAKRLDIGDLKKVAAGGVSVGNPGTKR